jgi:hypothetical protein
VVKMHIDGKRRSWMWGGGRRYENGMHREGEIKSRVKSRKRKERERGGKEQLRNWRKRRSRVRGRVKGRGGGIGGRRDFFKIHC